METTCSCFHLLTTIVNVKRIFLPLPLLVFIAACSGPKTDGKGTATVIAGDSLAKSALTPSTEHNVATSSLCFIRTDRRDTTNLEMLIKGSKITGQMDWMPFEKDSRKGSLSGTIKNDSISAVWSFMQEGMKDTLALKFLIKGDKLMQKPLKLNTKTGREQTDGGAGFTTAYRPSVTLKH